MATTLIIRTCLICLLMLAPIDATMGMSPNVPVAARPLRGSKARDYVTMKPQLNDKRWVMSRGGEVKGCKPKGFRHSSAPSRYVNYHTLGSLECSPASQSTKP